MPRPDFPRPRRVAKGLLNGACFAAAFAASAFLVGRSLPFPRVPKISPKYRYFAENLDRFDTIFIGSSRVYHQIDPQQFDAEVAALGGHTQSFNLAYDSVWPPESWYYLRRLLALRPPRLRWVFIELMGIQTRLEARNDRTLRTAYWHDWRHTVIAWRDIFAAPRSRAEKWSVAGEHAAIFLRWQVNFGRGAEALAEAVLPRKPERPELWLGRGGFLPENERQISPAELPGYLETVAHLARGVPPHRVDALHREALDGIVAEVRRAGAQPVFVITPTLSEIEHFTGLPAGVPVFSFADPAQYPALYAPENRYDAWHLNEKGAVELTSLLARHFGEYLRRP